jgi:hypothetical protein
VARPEQDAKGVAANVYGVASLQMTDFPLASTTRLH